MKTKEREKRILASNDKAESYEKHGVQMEETFCLFNSLFVLFIIFNLL